MIPVAFQGLEFPDQRQLDWTEYESLQWMRANQQYFHPDNGVYYDTGSITKISSLPDNGARFSTLASNGKIYGAGDLAEFVYILDPDTDLITSASAGTTLRSFGVFNSPFTKKVYISGGPNGSLNLSTIDTTTDTFTYNVTGSISEAAFYPISPTLDGRFAIGPTRPDENLVRVNLLEDGLTTLSTGQWTGDHNNGALTWNNKQWHSIGGGSSGFLIIDCATGTVDEPNYTGGLTGLGSDDFRHLIQHPNGYVYSFEFKSPYRIIQIDPLTNDIEIVGNVPGGQQNWTVFELGFDGRIYIGGGDTDLGVFDPVTNTTFTFSSPTSAVGGIATSLNGDIYIFSGNFANNDGVWKIPLVGKEKIKGILQTGNHHAGRFRANY